MPSLDIVTGALLVGTWVNSLLYSVEASQVIRYFRSFPNDDWYLKALVISAFLLDTASAVGNYAAVYLYTITHAGDMLYLSNQNWTFPLLIFTTGLVAAEVQVFLVARYWRFSKNIFITLFFFLVIIVATGACFATGITVTRFPSYVDRSKARVFAATWVISQAVTDLLIAVALVWQFRRVKSSFKETQSMLNRLALQTIQTGSASAAVALAANISYLVNNESNVPLGIAYCLGRVYVLTMLSNLNVRALVNPSGTRSRSHGATSSATGGVPHDTRSKPTGSREDGIHVHRSAVVKIDADSEGHPMKSLRNGSDRSHRSESPIAFGRDAKHEFGGPF
ncbi:hypothetical protein MIND_01281500 [Mycena indigotica]|uniref:DUF6534 domain-containing protein n=1 Tax=Mycena indigotica TaxID=2126181 RepID=A0A8H6S4W9_9AGAR|nr:uncharacterized protein MIND_01281500 [Mycena indigotica]KAF7291370.1 hypothetical protein MIND_01281500 [Mycena indigotica]